MRTQVAIVGAGPSGLLLGQLLARAGVDNVDPRAAQRRLRARPHPRRRARAGHGRDAGGGRRRRAAAPRGPGPRRHRDRASRRAPPHRLQGARRQVRRRLRPDRGDARPDGRAPAPRARRPSTKPRTSRSHGFDGTAPRVRWRHEGGRTSSTCDFIAGCDGYHGVTRAERAARRDHDLRARLSVRLARAPRRPAAGVARAHLRQPRARVRAVQHAIADAQPLLPAMRGRREGRRVARRALLGRASRAARRARRTRR